MANETSRSKRSDSQDADNGRKATGSKRGDDSKDQEATRAEGRSQSRGQRSRGGGFTFNPSAAARAGLLNLADSMRRQGATYQAINAYERILIRYPGTGAATAATEGLVDLADQLQKEGKIYTALNIFTKLEQYY